MDGFILNNSKNSGTNIIVDSTLSTNSENPVQNKVIKTELTRLENLINSAAIGGGGSGTIIDSNGDTATLILLEENGMTVDTEYTFLNGAKLSDFDEIDMMILSKENHTSGRYPNSYSHTILNCQVLLDSSYSGYIWYGYYQRWLRCTFTDTTVNMVNSAAGNENNNQKPTVYAIFGIKHGSSSNSAGIVNNYSSTLILSEANGVDTSTSYTFINGAKLSDFDEIEVLCSTRGDKSSGDLSYSHFTYSVSTLQDQPTGHMAEYGYRWGMFTVTDTSLTQTAASTYGEGSQHVLRIYYVYGIKYATQVIAPSQGSGKTIKTLTWTGNGTATNTIQFPVSDEPTVILGLTGVGLENGVVVSITYPSFTFGVNAQIAFLWSRTTYCGEGITNAQFDTTNNTLTLSIYSGDGTGGGAAANLNGVPYILTYI